MLLLVLLQVFSGVGADACSSGGAVHSVGECVKYSVRVKVPVSELQHMKQYLIVPFFRPDLGTASSWPLAS